MKRNLHFEGTWKSSSKGAPTSIQWKRKTKCISETHREKEKKNEKQEWNEAKEVEMRRYNGLGHNPLNFGARHGD